MVNFYSVWPALAATALLLAIVSTSLFKAADTPPSSIGVRISSLDGLRGFLAYGVFFGHAAKYHHYLQNGSWGLTSPFYEMAQTGAVALFFMITGYLFWGKLLAERGRPQWINLFVGRAFRIGPLYFVAVAGMLVAVSLKTIGHEPVEALAKEIASWALLGLNYTEADVNGYHGTGSILFGVTWTLHFEWLFYFSLVLLAIPARFHRHLALVTIALIACVAHLLLTHRAGVKTEMMAELFLLGMLSASLEAQGWLLGGTQITKSALAVAFLCLFGATQALEYAPLPALLLGGLFYAVISGATIFGLLTSRPARRLGDVSFGIYLLQGLVVTAVFSFASARLTALRSPMGHWTLMALCGVILLVVATAAHTYIERPGIKAGKSIARWLRSGGLKNAPAGQTILPPRSAPVAQHSDPGRP